MVETPDFSEGPVQSNALHGLSWSLHRPHISIQLLLLPSLTLVPTFPQVLIPGGPPHQCPARAAWDREQAVWTLWTRRQKRRLLYLVWAAMLEPPLAPYPPHCAQVPCLASPSSVSLTVSPSQRQALCLVMMQVVVIQMVWGKVGQKALCPQMPPMDQAWDWDSHHYHQLLGRWAWALQSMEGWVGYTHTAKWEAHWKGDLEEVTCGKDISEGTRLEKSPELKLVFRIETTIQSLGHTFNYECNMQWTPMSDHYWFHI